MAWWTFGARSLYFRRLFILRLILCVLGSFGRTRPLLLRELGLPGRSFVALKLRAGLVFDYWKTLVGIQAQTSLEPFLKLGISMGCLVEEECLWTKWVLAHSGFKPFISYCKKYGSTQAIAEWLHALYCQRWGFLFLLVWHMDLARTPDLCHWWKWTSYVENMQ